MAISVRPAAVAGMFYPGSADGLARTLGDLLATAGSSSLGPGFRPAQPPGHPKAVIVPHAGYVYSGSTAALAYALLEPVRTTITRVILLGPCHRVYVRGLATSSAAAWRTPLGDVPLADPGPVLGLPHVARHDTAHAPEHSLEVQVPFLQTVLDEFELLPLAVGEASAAEVADVLEAAWGGPETLIVISSDLSHYLPYERARQVDAATIADILALRPLADHHQACGATPVNGMIEAARRRGLSVELLGACNSGDTAGDKHRVVGYASFALREPG